MYVKHCENESGFLQSKAICALRQLTLVFVRDLRRHYLMKASSSVPLIRRQKQLTLFRPALKKVFSQTPLSTLLQKIKAFGGTMDGPLKIGRASCRERVYSGV